MIILLCGPQGSGKTTLAQKLVTELDNAVVLKFADPLYAMHDAIYNILYEHGHPEEEKTDGTLLQIIGAWGRAKAQDFWVNIAKKRVTNLWHENALITTNGMNIIFDDCRFENEWRAFDRLDTVLKVRLTAPEALRKHRAAKWRENTKDASETGLDHIHDQDFDLVIDTGKVPKCDVVYAVKTKIALVSQERS